MNHYTEPGRVVVIHYFYKTIKRGEIKKLKTKLRWANECRMEPSFNFSNQQSITAKEAIIWQRSGRWMWWTQALTSSDSWAMVEKGEKVREEDGTWRLYTISYTRDREEEPHGGFLSRTAPHLYIGCIWYCSSIEVRLNCNTTPYLWTSVVLF